MYFHCITNLPAFFQRIRSCVGEVSFVDERGIERDLKKLAASVVNCDLIFCGSQLEKLEVRASCLEDRKQLIRYMSEMSFTE